MFKIFKLIKSFFFKNVYYTSEVFKNNGIPQYTLVKRHDIEDKLNEIVQLRNKVVLFLGYSKSGKTVYRKTFFNEKNIHPIVYRSNKDSTCNDFYNYICQEANIPTKTGVNNSSEETLELQNTTGIKDISSTNIKGISKSSKSKSYKYPDIKIDVNHVCNNLSKNRNICIVIEDFHLLNDNFSKTLSEDIKHFLDDEILLVIIGIPSSPSRALKNNPDLGGRTLNILFDYLHKEEINEILDKGEKKINVKFKSDVRDRIIENSMKNVFLVQSIALKLLESNGIKKSSTNLVEFSDPNDVDKACIKLKDELYNDYKEIINSILGGSRTQQKNKAYNQYKEILRAIKEFSIEQLENGITYADIGRNSWSKFDPVLIGKYLSDKTYKDETSFRSSLNNQISGALTKLHDNFIKKNAREVVIYYDNKLYLMDLVFKFYLIWDTELIN